MMFTKMIKVCIYGKSFCLEGVFFSKIRKGLEIHSKRDLGMKNKKPFKTSVYHEYMVH